MGKTIAVVLLFIAFAFGANLAVPADGVFNGADALLYFAGAGLILLVISWLWPKK